MIQSKEDLREYIQKDTERMGGKPKLRDLILHNEKWYIHKYVVALRHVEYYMNCNGGARRIFYSCFGGIGTNILGLN
jgi:hypothetical protein